MLSSKNIIKNKDYATPSLSPTPLLLTSTQGHRNEFKTGTAKSLDEYGGGCLGVVPPVGM